MNYSWDTVVGVLVLALVPISLFASIAFVRVFRPFATRVADLLEDYLEDRSREREERTRLSTLEQHLSSLDDRMELMEERLDYTESLVAETDRGPPLTSAGTGGEAEQTRRAAAGDDGKGG